MNDPKNESAKSNIPAPPSEEVGEIERHAERLANWLDRDGKTGWATDVREMRSLILRLSAPPVAAPSGEAAPREADIPARALALADALRLAAKVHEMPGKPIDGKSSAEVLTSVADFLPVVVAYLRTLSDGKAAAEARAKEAEARSAADRERLAASGCADLAHAYTEALNGKIAAESRCAALERALTITRGQWIHSVHAERCLAALSAEPAKPVNQSKETK